MSDLKEIKETFKETFKEKKEFHSKGIIAMEYILLLLVFVAMAGIIVGGLVSFEEDSEGVIVRKWKNVIEFIGNDWSDDVN